MPGRKTMGIAIDQLDPGCQRLTRASRAAGQQAAESENDGPLVLLHNLQQEMNIMVINNITINNTTINQTLLLV